MTSNLFSLAGRTALVTGSSRGLGRSMAHLVTLIEALLERQIGVRSLCDGAIDTATASGELVFHLFSALAQFERRLIQERTRAGIAAARARGKQGGRQPLRPEDPRVRMAYTMYGDPRLTVADICRTLRISPATFYRYVALGRRAAEHTSGNGGLSKGLLRIGQDQRAW